MDEQKMQALTTVLINTLSISVELCVRKNMFGQLKPTDNQVGWAFGFCDAPTQANGLDQAESLALIAIVFSEVFGKNLGPKLVRKVIHNQQRFFKSMSDGGNSFQDWGGDGKAPIMPSN